ncbi:MAG: NAD(P)/FAD-dependent oxidoreductase [Myxococcota bacterium]
MVAQDTVLVVGGGPAGATAAALLAREGVPVRIVEKLAFPRHHVGESLQPASMDLLERHFGLRGRIAAAGFPRKYGAVYVWGESRAPWSVLFDPRLEAALPATEAELLAGDYEHAWNVDRAAFDAILLEEAVRRGARLETGVEALAPVTDGERVVGLRVRTPAGSEEVWPSSRLVDASGQRCLLGHHFRMIRSVEDMRATATYAYFDGAGGVEGVLGRHVQLVVTVDDGWVWFIPIGATRTSVGVVTRSRERLDEARFDAILAGAGLPLAGATAVRDPYLRFARDWSFVCARLAGPGWLVAGDAACFVDPILSGGVDFAIRGGLNAALAILRGEDGTAYEEALRKEYRAYLRLARYWYGNNRSVQGLFWEAHQEIPPTAASMPSRAFVYLTTGRYAADAHVRVFQEWQEKKMFRALGVDVGALKKVIGPT